MARKASELLDMGLANTRKKLAELLGTKDATLYTGIFQPKGFDSILVFVTEEKQADRPQYRDRFSGDDLEMDSQPKGRYNSKLIDHEALGLEILLFHRKRKDELPEYAFRYRGLSAILAMRMERQRTSSSDGLRFCRLQRWPAWRLWRKSVPMSGVFARG